MILKSKNPNFILRPKKKNDLKFWYENQLDTETKKNFMSIPKNFKQAKKEFFKTNKNSEKFIIDVGGECIGSIGINSIVEGHKAVISYWVAKKFRKKGIATKALKLATNYFFKKYKLKRISGNVRTFNKASAKVLENAGYNLEGVLRKNKLKGNKFMDDMIYSKIK